jgi:phage-related protein
MDSIAKLRYHGKPGARVLFYREPGGRSPVLEWLEVLRRTDREGFAKCMAVIERLREVGHELRRPTADFLAEGIHELRARKGRVNYRILYFFHGRGVAVLAHGLTKEAGIPAADMERALRRKRAFEQDPRAHTYREST